MIKAQNFPYVTTAVSEKAFKMHYQLYERYVNKVNEILEKMTRASLDDANNLYSHIRALKMELSYNLDAVIYHEHYFKALGDGKDQPGQGFIKLVKKDFGSFEAWAKDFEAAALSARGWALCCYEQRTCRILNTVQDTYSDNVIVNAYPLLSIDLFEHGRVLDYGPDIKAYVSASMKAIKWPVIEQRCKLLEGN